MQIQNAAQVATDFAATPRSAPSLHVNPRLKVSQSHMSQGQQRVSTVGPQYLLMPSHDPNKGIESYTSNIPYNESQKDFVDNVEILVRRFHSQESS